MNKVYTLLSEKNYIFNKELIKAIDYDISLVEFLVLVYIMNDNNKIFDAEAISKEFNLDIEKVLDAFNSLLSHNILLIEQGLDNAGRISDVISLNNIYKLIDNNLNDEKKLVKKDTIFDMIEKEFGKSLTPMEIEIINAWLDFNSEELIIGAIKEATYNGVKNLRYIDKILYEWGKKGYKTMDDVNKGVKEREENKKVQEYEDFDWLNDDE